jgi:hypothetical protein
VPLNNLANIGDDLSLPSLHRNIQDYIAGLFSTPISVDKLGVSCISLGAYGHPVVFIDAELQPEQMALVREQIDAADRAFKEDLRDLDEKFFSNGDQFNDAPQLVVPLASPNTVRLVFNLASHYYLREQNIITQFLSGDDRSAAYNAIAQLAEPLVRIGDLMHKHANNHYADFGLKLPGASLHYTPESGQGYLDVSFSEYTTPDKFAPTKVKGAIEAPLLGVLPSGRPFEYFKDSDRNPLTTLETHTYRYEVPQPGDVAPENVLTAFLNEIADDLSKVADLPTNALRKQMQNSKHK